MLKRINTCACVHGCRSLSKDTAVQPYFIYSKDQTYPAAYISPNTFIFFAVFSQQCVYQHLSHLYKMFCKSGNKLFTVSSCSISSNDWYSKSEKKSLSPDKFIPIHPSQSHLQQSPQKTITKEATTPPTELPK